MWEVAFALSLSAECCNGQGLVRAGLSLPMFGKGVCMLGRACAVSALCKVTLLFFTIPRWCVLVPSATYNGPVCIVWNVQLCI